MERFRSRTAIRRKNRRRCFQSEARAERTSRRRRMTAERKEREGTPMRRRLTSSNHYVREKPADKPISGGFDRLFQTAAAFWAHLLGCNVVSVTHQWVTSANSFVVYQAEVQISRHFVGLLRNYTSFSARHYRRHQYRSQPRSLIDIGSFHHAALPGD